MKIHLLAISILLACPAAAQLAENQFIAGGSFGASRWAGESSDSSNTYNTSYNSSYKSHSASIPVHFGYMLTKKVAVGITASYSYFNSSQRNKSTFSGSPNSNWNENVTLSKNREFSAGAFARLYQPVSTRFVLFLHVSGTALKGETVTETEYSNQIPATPVKDTLRTAISGFGLSVNPGLSYFITKRIGIEMQSGSVSYFVNETSTYREKSKVGTNRNEFFNFQGFLTGIRLGVTFYIGGSGAAPQKTEP